MSLTHTPETDAIELVAFAVECRYCGSPVAPEALSRSDGVTAFLPVKCTKTGCRRSWVIKAELIAVRDPAGTDR